MKPVRPKIHVIDLAEPLLCFSDLIPRCGVTVKHAEPVFMLAEDEGIVFTFPMRTCMTCLRQEPKGESKRQYVYGICEAESARHLTEES